LLDESDQIVEAFSGDRTAVALEKLNGREGNLLLVNGINQPDLQLSRSVPHRIRMVNVANSRFMRVGIDDHPLIWIGGDQGLAELPVDYRPLVSSKHLTTGQGLVLTPGERAEVVLNPDQMLTSTALTWFDYDRGRHTVEFVDDGATVLLGHANDDGLRPSQVLANITYVDADPLTPYLLRNMLKDVPKIAFRDAPTLPLVLGHTIPDWDTGDVVFFVQAPGKPFAILNPEDVHTVLPDGVYVWEIKNLTAGAHNFHTHGFPFQFISTTYVDNQFPDDPTLNFTIGSRNVENKDTIILHPRPGAKGSSFSLTRLAVRFDDAGRRNQIGAHGKMPSADKPGGWLAHCNLLEHTASGMMTFFQLDQLFADNFEDQ
jgi:FtsP/CotA-like multicopper oxidase with cupredoxin domain